MAAHAPDVSTVTNLAYPPARAVAETVEAHFRRHLELARADGFAGEAFIPDAGAVEALVDAAFWASLRRDEGRAPKISLAYLPPEAAGQPLQLERALPLDPTILTRIAPAAERPGIHVGVWRDGGEPYLWGATRTIPPLALVLEVVAPGLLVIKHRRADPEGKFANVAVLEGDQVKIVDAERTLSSECPAFVAFLLGADSENGGGEGILLPLALSMRAHGHGGTLLIVPHDSEEWRKSILWPVPYAVAPPFSRLGDLMRAGPAERSQGAWHDGFRGAVAGIGGLTAVDGATVLSDRWDVLAFGATIGRRESGPPVERVLLKEPIAGRMPVTARASELGNTRHISAAQFAYEQHEALALVASQDGRFTVFAWSDREQIVYAYRVEALLL
jgi:hypothetical protein